MTRIEQFGWHGAVEAGIGRIVSSHGDYYQLVGNEAGGEILARKKKANFRNAELTPITGDFVRYRYNSQGESLITEVLPRFSCFERKDPTARRKSQVLAVNFDTLFIMMSLNENFSLPRLERYLTLAADIGRAEAVVLLTKSDLLEQGGETGDGKPDLASLASGITCPCFSISAKTGDGLDRIATFFAPGRTVAFIGSSGVGKSSLVNALAGEEWQATQEIQEWSGKGRHTTTSRELIMLPGGAMVVDTPGIREIGMIGESEQLQRKGESTHRWRK